MKFRSLLLMAALYLAIAMPAAQAGTVTASFTGTVGNYFSLPILQDDFPIGTPVSMVLTYDDGFRSLGASQLSLGMTTSASGTLTLGAANYLLDAMSLTGFTYGATADVPPPHYDFHVTGTGPATDDNEPFSGLMFSIFGGNVQGISPLIGFGNPNWLVANNGYLITSGTSSFVRVENQIPLPSTLLLILPGLVFLRRRMG